MIRIAVCDDESEIRKSIANLIKKHTGDVEISVFQSGKEMLETTAYFDIAFLDIAMSGISGIQVAKRIRMAQEKANLDRSIIIFVTGYREYMEDAFDVNAFHYLVKPIDEKKFTDVLSRAIKLITEKEVKARKSIILKYSGIQKKVLLQDIYYIESCNKKVIVHTKDGNIQLYGKMDEFENELGDIFYRCHRCFLVNMEKITKYSVDTIQVINGETLILARKKYPDFIKKYMRYAKAGGIVNV